MADRTRRVAGAGAGRMLAGLALLLGCPDPSRAAGESSGPAAFPRASVYFEQNATDGDVEVVFRATGREEGLAKLRVVGPDGRTVIDFAAPDASTLGIRQFHFESPEPADVGRLKAAYPAGVYRFSGATASGKELRGEHALSHELPATTSFVAPAPEAEGVPVSGMKITWKPVAGVSGYLIELEQDELDVRLEASLPASATSFPLPDGFLRPGTEYDLGIGTRSQQGNVSFVETTFTTAK